MQASSAAPAAHTAVLLDHHPLWLDAVGSVLRRLGIEVVGTATSGDDALALIREHEPDLFVTEIAFGREDMAGLECVRQARTTARDLKAIVLSVYEDPQYVDAALEAGAAAYVIKTVHPDDFASAIRQAFDHSIYFAGSAVGSTPAPAPAASVEDDAAGLTRREFEILQLVAEGHSNAELARMLWVTEQTVKFHLSNIYRKLDVSNRTEASRWAQLNGLLSAAPVAAATAA
jgi:DNA-binding NarL/FixJ family response regulator